MGFGNQTQLGLWHCTIGEILFRTLIDGIMHRAQRGWVTSRGSQRNVVPYYFHKGASSLKGVYSFLLRVQRQTGATVVLPTPGGP